MFILFIASPICKGFITAVSIWKLTGIWISLKLCLRQPAYSLNSHLITQETSDQQDSTLRFQIILKKIISTLGLGSISLVLQKKFFQTLNWNLQWFVINYSLLSWTHWGTTTNHHSHPVHFSQVYMYTYLYIYTHVYIFMCVFVFCI